MAGNSSPENASFAVTAPFLTCGAGGAADAQPTRPFVKLLKLDDILVNVGAMEALLGVHGIGMIHGQKSIVGSMIGGIAETQQVIDYCAARSINKATARREGNKHKHERKLLWKRGQVVRNKTESMVPQC